jgi:hypothetical protein
LAMQPPMTTVSFDGLDLDLPPGLFEEVDGAIVANLVKASYRRVLESVARDRTQKQNEVKKAEDLRKKTLDSAARLDPKEALAAAVEQAIEAKYAKPKPRPFPKPKYEFDHLAHLGAKIAGDAKDGDDPVTEKTYKRRWSKSELSNWKPQKNSQSREGVSGTIKTPSSKGKGKGKGKAQAAQASQTQQKPKSKGKGKASDKGKGKSGKGSGNPPKGKGKGKGGKNK